VVVVLVVVLVVVEVTVAVVVVVDVVVITVVVVRDVEVVVGSEVEVVVTIVVRVVALDEGLELVLLDDEVVVPSTVLDVELLVDELVLVELLVVDDELVLVVVPGTGSGASMAPTSHSAVRSPSPSMGRTTPRWSTDGLGHCAAASIAGLPGKSACVKVPSPASASVASCGFVPG
jgi:hypothetical protein